MITNDKSVGGSDSHDWAFLEPRTSLVSRHELLKMVVSLAYEVPGNIMEFGVASGNSTRVIRKAATKIEREYEHDARKRIFACDSFEGLPEKYENAEVGAFACKPPNIRGVEIVKGYFDDSLDDKLAEEVGSVSFASLDADLYSSTICVLNWLTPLLHTGSLLLFDEFLGGDEAEKRAFEEWTTNTGTKAVLIGQFLRKPSAWGERPDCRTLYQVVKDDVTDKNQKKQTLKRKSSIFLRQRSPAIHKAVRSLYKNI